MENYKNIKVEVGENIMTLTINRPDKMNALNFDTLGEIESAIKRVYSEKEIRGVVITGSGEKAFVAGADISEIAGVKEGDEAYNFSKNGQRIFSFIENSPKPIIAAVNGFALGGGCELALACHIRLASENAKFGLPEVTLGIIPGYGGTQRMVGLVGKGKALEIMLTGGMITAVEAHEIGLVNEVLPAAELIIKAKALLNKIFRNAPMAVAKVIEAANAVLPESGYEAEAKAFAECCKSEDFKEGTTAFLEKRKANFKGV
jgi:enoyl-CoA hydratase